jgi:hypothetical protein
VIVQKRIFAEDIGKRLLYRIVIDTDCRPVEVVTVYRTSKLKKYEE